MPDPKRTSAAVPPEVAKMLRDVARPEYLTEDGRLVGRHDVSSLFNGWRYVAIGARMVKIAPETTFHEFLEGLVGETLGRAWVAAQQAKPRQDRHPIAQWQTDLALLRTRPPVAVRGGVSEATGTGSSLAFLTLAYDLYSILHCGALPTPLVKRLKLASEFQGARYEVAVAALFARAGFTLEWIRDYSRKRPEFIAAHKTTGERVAVEAKSRHRAGVLAQGGVAEVDAMKADLDGLLRAALQKETDGLPFAIYLDANLPIVGNDESAAWTNDVERMLNGRPAPTRERPDPFAAITVTNFSWHYAGDAAAPSRSESVMVLPKYSRAPLRDDRTLRLIFEAGRQYGAVPATFPSA
ncbi:MAG: hypothetical protein M3T56_08520 [Chloroflexota bacterium]|nr:hypothetical protein [Chloroflexota bacterium]